MPKIVNRPHDEIEAHQMQQGPIDFAEKMPEQMGDADDRNDSSEQQSPA